jgi:peptidoglycan/LPS O-acetylase OafA/YrhL
MTHISNRFDSLTGLRGVLALLVVVAHGVGRVGWYEKFPEIEPLFIAFGHFGVVGFFILSGFILSSVYKNRNWTLLEFATNRFARIYPLYLACLLFTLPIDWLTPGFPQEGRIESLALSVILQQSWFEFSNGRFNGPGWTLSVEFFFYSLFPLLFWINHRYPRIFIFCFIVTFAITAILWDPSNFHLAHRVPHMRLWEFILGMIAADLFRMFPNRQMLRSQPSLIAAIALICGILFGAYATQITSWPFVEWVTMAGSALIMILSLAVADTATTKSPILATNFCVLAGEISYAVYLIHDGIQRYGKVAIERIGGTTTENLPIAVNLAFIFISIIASFICAFVLWNIVEKPARNFLRQTFIKDACSLRSVRTDSN